MPATVDDLKVYLGLEPASTVDAEAMGKAVAAANDTVVAYRPDLALDPETGDMLAAWVPRAEQAALVEAARLYGRRGSIGGSVAYADLGIAPLPRLDPEFKMLLELGEYQKNVIA